MSAYINHGKTSLKRNSGRESTLKQKDHRKLRIVSKNNIITAQVTAELNIHLEDPVSTKTVRHELHKSNIHDRAAIAKPPITERNAQMCKRWCHDHKTWTSDNRKRARDMVRGVVLHALPYSFEHSRKPTIRTPVSKIEILGRFYDAFGSNIMV
jgi:hypothetical protein